MNILPKKRWHVRTKENIARVRRDEAKAAEEEKERLRKVALAEQEFRTAQLRKQAAERRGAIGETPGGGVPKLEAGAGAADKQVSIVGSSGHINFFQHLENGERDGGPNEEHLKEKKEEQEKYEKSIGLLTYLGQGSREETKQKAWFETLPVDRAKERSEAGAEEVKKKAKDFEDPLNIVKRLVGESKDDKVGKKVSLQPPVRLTTAETSTKKPSEGSAARKRPRDSSSDEESHSRRKKRAKEKKDKKKKHKKEKKRKKSDSRSRSKSKKSRRRSPSSGSSSSDDSDEAEEEAARKIQLERMRVERLQREKEERERAEQLLRKLRGEEPEQKRHEEQPKLKQRYNAQFNPYLARQNYREK